MTGSDLFLNSYFICLYVVLLAYAPHAARVVLIARTSDKSYNIFNPRKGVQYAIDKSSSGDQIQRLSNAHYNLLEGQAAFFGGVLSAKLAGVDCYQVDRVAQFYLALRIAYVFAYGYGAKSNMVLAGMRMLIFVLSLGACVFLFYLAAVEEAGKRI